MKSAASAIACRTSAGHAPRNVIVSQLIVTLNPLVSAAEVAKGVNEVLETSRGNCLN